MKPLICLLTISMFAGSASAEEALAARVRQSMDRGIKFLKEQQRFGGGDRWDWESSTITVAQPGGPSCLAMLALLTAGVPTDDAVVKRGLTYIRSLVPMHTYVVGLQTMVLQQAGDVRDLNLIQRNVNWLIDAAVTKGGKLGGGGSLQGWTYNATERSWSDNSNTQYAMLGLWAGQEAGAKVDRKVWEAIHKYYVESQVPGGRNREGLDQAGWVYNNNADNKLSLTMSVAGLCGLYISNQELGENLQGLDTKTGIAKNCGVYPDDDALAKGHRWVGANLAFTLTPHSFYNVYGIERLGRLSGKRFLGDADWYREGCELLTGWTQDGKRKVSDLNQKPGGEWGSGNGIDGDSIISTSFALLFLSKGRTPILISKFAYDKQGDRPGINSGWNRKHSDTRHLVEYSSRELFKRQPLAWQNYDPRLADLTNKAVFDDELATLLQSPVLYINGHEAPQLTTAQKRLLRRYVDEGGFIMAEACCGSPEFAKGFRELMADKEVFGDESPLLPLAPTHPIWSSHTLIPAEMFQSEKIPEAQRIHAIERGCKTVVVFIPQPLAGFWEDGQLMPKPNEIVVNTDRARMAYRLAGNIIAYATGLEPPRPRLDKQKILDNDQKVPKGARYLIELAQIRHDGGDWQPAKNAMRNLALYARDKFQLDVSLAKQEVRPGRGPELWAHKFLYMHGKGRFTIDANEAENLRAHLEAGGTLLADACCGSSDFDKAFRQLTDKVFPGEKLVTIPENDLLYSAELNGQQISQVRARLEKNDGSAEANFRDVKPMLEGIKRNDRWVIIYSKIDIGCALEKNRSSACKGYDPESASRLATAALLYSLQK
ncbi:MAG: DUF4159 domain-containing protein [Zavarzinella sp.]